MYICYKYLFEYGWTQMTMETSGQSYYSMEYYDDPEWWDRWCRRNLKKKVRAFSRQLKEEES